MVRRSVHLQGPDDSLAVLGRRFARIRADLDVPDAFPGEVLAEARRAARSGPTPGEYADLDDVRFITVDPPGATDLDQALHIRRRGSGYHVDYAIADVPAFVAPGAALDVEARRRGQTLYAPDRRVPLHPPVLSEDAASLLQGRRRTAFVWRFDLDEAGRVEGVDLVRAWVRNRRRLDYAAVQAAADGQPGAGSARDPLVDQAVLLREVGQRRQEIERERGGASLPLPEQEVVADRDRYRLVLRPALPAEEWNAQLSLLTGMAAARIMLDGGVGLLRTMPAPEPAAVTRFRRQSRALGVEWPQPEAYGDLLRRLRRDVPAELALMYEAASLFRGAGYTPLLPGAGTEPGGEPVHAAVAAPYAHVTAPLRRLVDRFGLLVCHALVGGRGPAPEVVEALATLPGAMAASDGVAGRLERRCTDVVEAAVLADRVGHSFAAVVVDRGRSGPKVQILDPAVLARARGEAEVGTETTVRLVAVDPDAGRVEFEIG